MTSNNRRFSLVAALLLSSVVFVAVPASATLYEAATFDEKVDHATAIVVGKVIRKETRFDNEKKWILTYTTFQVEKSLKGNTPSEITLVTPGGRIGNVTQTTAGIPTFDEGAENVVFVRNTRLGPTVLYNDQGAYELVRDGSDRVVRPVASDAVVVDTQRGVAVAAEEPRTLRQFESAIQSSERRVRHNRMELLRRQKEQQADASSFTRTVADNKWLIIIGALGIALASIHLLKRM